MERHLSASNRRCIPQPDDSLSRGPTERGTWKGMGNRRSTRKVLSLRLYRSDCDSPGTSRGALPLWVEGTRAGALVCVGFCADDYQRCISRLGTREVHNSRQILSGHIRISSESELRDSHRETVGRLTKP